MDPKDEDELQDMMFTALQQPGPSAIRYPRGTGPGSTVKSQPIALEIGKAEILREGSDVAIFALGCMVTEANKLATILAAEGQSVAVINARFAKPIDDDCIARFARRCGVVVTMEDHVLAGGFGSAVLESLNTQEIDVAVVRVGWPDEFIEHGKPEDLRQKYGLTATAVADRVRPNLKKAVAV
jgi:1-deoxy-D-xylulose-5-phosphate synthase